MEEKAIQLARLWFYKHVHELPVKTFRWESMGDYSQGHWIKEAALDGARK